MNQDLALRNLLVGADWRVRIADFGLARMMPQDMYAKTRGNIGALRWLAPEVCNNTTSFVRNGNLICNITILYYFHIILLGHTKTHIQ